MIEIIKYLILGIIQGITEVFPVSSSGHLTIFVQLSNKLSIGEPINLNYLTIFLMLTNFGSLIAITIYFWKDLVGLLKSFFTFFFKYKEAKMNVIVMNDMSYILKLFIAVVPIGILGLLLEDILPNTLIFVGSMLIITGLLLLYIYSIRNKKFENDITFKRSVIIGLFQAFAVLPGISRSGITMIGGLSQKIEIKKVLKFSFIAYVAISIPVSIKGIIDIVNASEQSESINILGYLLAFLTSFIATFITIRILYKFVKIKNLIYFSLYCLSIGIVAIILHLTL